MRVDASQRVIDQPRHRKAGRWLLAGGLLGFAIIAGYYGYRQGSGESVESAMLDLEQVAPVDLTSQAMPTENDTGQTAAVDDATPVPQPVAAEPLPALADSDALVTTSLLDVLGTGRKAWLPEDDLVRRQAVLLNGLSHGAILRKPWPLPAANGAFSVTRRNDRLYLSAANYSRYDSLVRVVEAVDQQQAIAWFGRFEPLLQQAWNELGTPRTGVRQALLATLELALATPDIDGEIELARPSVLYRFADPALEALPDVQKLLLRVGPENRVRLKRVCRDLLVALRQR